MLKCAKCGVNFLGKWLNRQIQYGKLINAGYAKEEVEKMMPLCPVCFKQALRKNALHAA